MQIVNDMFDGLVLRGPDGHIVPAQAVHWKTSADGLTWTFTLRKSQWSDGQPVTASDFVRGWQRAVTPSVASPYAWYLELMAVANAHEIILGHKQPQTLGVKALAPDTLQVTLEHPVPWLTEMLMIPVLYPAPPGIIEKYGDKWTDPAHIVTNGPYSLNQWVVNEKVELNASHHYPNAKQLPIQQVTYLMLPSQTAAYNRYRAGDMDITVGIPVGYYPKLKADHPDDLRITHGLGTEYYAFNVRQKPFNDVRVRKALSLALERELITDKVLGEGQVPAYSFTPAYMKGMPNYQPLPSTMSRAQRLAEAQRLYREAGYGPNNPLRFSLLYNTSESRQKTAIAAASMWKQNLGAEVTLENMEWKSAVSRIRQKDFQLARASWVADFNNPVSMLSIFSSISSSNKPGYQNPLYDELLARLKQPGAHRGQLFVDMENQLLQDVPVIPLYHYVSPSLVNPKVQGWYDDPQELVQTRYLSLKGDATQP